MNNNILRNKIKSFIYGHGRGWYFSQGDLAHLASRGSIDAALSFFAANGIVRRVMIGLSPIQHGFEKMCGNGFASGSVRFGSKIQMGHSAVRRNGVELSRTFHSSSGAISLLFQRSLKNIRN